MKELIGTGVALVTPFQKDRSIDFPALEKLVEHLISNDVDYIVVQGTTGESATLSNKEKQDVLDEVIRVNSGRVPLVFGIGGNDTLSVSKSMQSFRLTNVDAILSVSPYYNKPSQEGIFRHYEYLDSVTPLPLIVYNVPSRTASNIEVSTTVRLAKELKNVVAIKEASGNLGQAMEIIKNVPKDFLVISGDDILTLPMIGCGAHGVISVIGNAYPKEFSTLVKNALEGDLTSARDKHYLLLEMMNAIFKEGNPSGIKKVLYLKGLLDNYLRLPLVPVSKSLSDELDLINKLIG